MDGQQIFDPGNIGAVIQLCLAPVFLLVGIGNLLNVVTQRLGRIVDRARELEELLKTDEADEKQRHCDELNVVDSRMKYANRAMVMCTISALLTCALVALLFVGTISGVSVSSIVGIMFILSMLTLIGGLIQFLAEVSVAIKMLRVRSDLLMREETPS